MLAKIFIDDTVVSRDHFIIKMSGQCKDYLNPAVIRQMVIKKRQIRSSQFVDAFAPELINFQKENEEESLPNIVEKKARR